MIIKTNAFWFQKSIENGVDNLWLCFENGMINLNLLAESKPSIIGKQMKIAIDKALQQIN